MFELRIWNLSSECPVLGMFPVEYFNKDENSTGSLTAGLSDNAEKISGLAGTTLGT